jgi:hypothetical protein
MIDVALLLPKILAGAGDNADLAEIAAKIAWRVADAVWQKQLQPMSGELIFRINKLLRQKVVERIEFRIDPRALNRLTAPRRSAPRVSEPLPTTIISSAAGIGDPELRERFMRAARNCIERRETRTKGKSAIRIPKSEI